MQRVHNSIFVILLQTLCIAQGHFGKLFTYSAWEFQTSDLLVTGPTLLTSKLLYKPPQTGNIAWWPTDYFLSLFYVGRSMAEDTESLCLLVLLGPFKQFIPHKMDSMLDTKKLIDSRRCERSHNNNLPLYQRDYEHLTASPKNKPYSMQVFPL